MTQVKTQEKEGYTALQLGAGSKKAKRLNRSERGHFIAGDVPFSAELTEFRVSPDAILPVGTAIGASHFSAGQYVDIQGRTIGKGFQGPMKRWGFSGLPASHGTTKKHRAHGSIGNSQDPGRVWKGKKMAGRMGNRKRTSLVISIMMTVRAMVRRDTPPKKAAAPMSAHAPGSMKDV